MKSQGKTEQQQQQQKQKEKEKEKQLRCRRGNPVGPRGRPTWLGDRAYGGINWWK